MQFLKATILLVVLFNFSSITNIMAQNENPLKTKLIYFGDPMCSWCYGFAPEIEKVATKFDGIDFEIVLGGLRPGGKQTMAEMKDFLKQHWQEIEEQTFQKFSYDILDLGDYVYNTEPASRAVETARHLKPIIALDFFKAVQTAFYLENKSTHDINTYISIAKNFDLDEEQYEALFNSKEMIEKTNANFVQSAEMGVRGFPTLVLEKDGKFHLISNGYQTADKLIPAIEDLLK